MLVVAVVMILVVGPKDLPGMLRTIGKSVGNVRRMASDFQRQFSDALKESEFDEIKKDLTQATSIPNPLDDINKSAEEMMEDLDFDPDDADDAIASDILETKPITPAKKQAVAKTTAKTTVKKATATKPKAVAKKTVARKPAAKKAPAKKTATKAKAAPKSKTT